MSLDVRCGNCGKSYRVGESLAGKRVRCRACGNVIEVAKDAAAPTAPVKARPQPPRPQTVLPSPRTPAQPVSDDPFENAAALAAFEEGAAAFESTAQIPGEPEPQESPVYTPAARVNPHVTIAGEEAIDRVVPWVLIAGFVACVLVSALKGGGVDNPTGPAAARAAASMLIVLVLGAPLCLLGVFVASRVMRFVLPDALFIKCVAVASVPWAMGLAFNDFNFVASLLSPAFFAGIPVMLVVLWLFLRLRVEAFSAAAGMALALCVGLPALGLAMMGVGSAKPGAPSASANARLAAGPRTAGPVAAPIVIHGTPVAGRSAEDEGVATFTALVEERLRAILEAVNRYAAEHDGHYPVRLEDVGLGDLRHYRDPKSGVETMTVGYDGYGDTRRWVAPLPKDVIVASGVVPTVGGPFRTMVIFADGRIRTFADNAERDAATRASAEAEKALPATGDQAAMPAGQPPAQGGGGADEAQAVGVTWLAAMGTGDAATVKSVTVNMDETLVDALGEMWVAKRGLEEAGAAKFGAAGPRRPMEFEALRQELNSLRAFVHGDTATIGDSRQMVKKLTLRRIGGQWRVDGAAFGWKLPPAETKLSIANVRLLAQAQRDVAQGINDGKYANWTVASGDVERRLEAARKTDVAFQEALKEAGGDQGATVLATPGVGAARPGPLVTGPPVEAPKADAIPEGATRTEMLGGKGGGPFVNARADRTPVVGFKYTLGRWRGESVLGHLDPIFNDATVDDLAGKTVVMAKPGYVVGGMLVDADDVNTVAVRVIFVRYADGKVNAADQYTSPWVGTPRNKRQQKLAGGGETVIGTFGRQGMNLDALGLVVMPAAK